MSASVWIIRALAAIVGGGTLFLTLPKLLRPPAAGLPKGFRLPVIALEWVQAPEQFSDIIEKVPFPIIQIRRGLRLDSFVIVPLYVTLFISLGFWLRVSGSARDAILVGAVIVCVLAAALFDIRENRSTRLALDSYEMNTLNHSLLIRKYQAYAAKWALIAFVLALLATLSLLRARPFGGVALLLAAVGLGIGLAGRHSLVEWGYGLMGIGLLLIAFSV